MRKVLSLVILTVLLVALSTCDGNDNSETSTGRIFLYGEQHGIERIMHRQLEIWHDYYHSHGMRHLFTEFPFFAAEFLNMWMQADNDDILYELHNDWEGTLGGVSYKLDFLKAIKHNFPETIFHGTDVGHQADTTGERFIRHLVENGLQGTEQYLLARENIDQGWHWFNTRDLEFRVTTMAENFIREFDGLDGQDIMAIHGASHTAFGITDGQTFPTLAQQLLEHYGDDTVYSTDLWVWMSQTPIRTDTITINGVDYQALFFGEQELSGLRNFVSREFWRLEKAYEDFRYSSTTGDVLPFSIFPMQVVPGQVFVVDMKLANGNIQRMFYRSDGEYWMGRPTTHEFIP